MTLTALATPPLPMAGLSILNACLAVAAVTITALFVSRRSGSPLGAWQMPALAGGHEAAGATRPEPARAVAAGSGPTEPRKLRWSRRPPGYPFPTYGTTEWHEAAARFRERRIDAGLGRTKLRAAVSGLGPRGFYAFEDLNTDEAGPLDQVLVGPHGVFILTLMPHRGHVWADMHENVILWGPEPPANTDEPGAPNPPTARPFEEHFYELRKELADDVHRKIMPPGVFVNHYLCFTEAELHRDAAGNGPPAAVSVWDLARVIVPAGEEADAYDPLDERYDDADTPPGAEGLIRPEHVDVYADAIVRAYSRRPWLVPEGREDTPETFPRAQD